MRRLIACLGVACLAALLSAAPAGADFGLKNLDVTFTDQGGAPVSQAGAHPFAMSTNLDLNVKPEPAFPEIGEVPDGEVKDLLVRLIDGFGGNPSAAPACSTVDFIEGHCARSAVVGTVRLIIGGPHEEPEIVPVYNLTPPPGRVAKLGFIALGVPVPIEASLEPEPPYRVYAEVTNIANLVMFYSSRLTLWGVPADPAHDTARGGPAGVAEVPFITLPRACEGPLQTVFEATSWQGALFSEAVSTHDDSEPPQPRGFTDCGKLAFSPQAEAKPTTDQAESPSGLEFNLDVEDQGLTNPDGIAASDIKKATVILPEGITLNPSIAEGLATCSKQGYGAESLGGEPGQGCPQASKVGSVEAETPVLPGTVLKGSLFVAAQDDPATTEPEAENPFDSLIALYMVIKEPERGILIKLAGKVEPNPVSGQIETTFGEPGNELPQQPLSHVRIRLREGGRSPLITPPSCDANPATPGQDPYTIKTIFTPWANPQNPLVTSSQFTISHGVGGGPCPTGNPPFEPGFSAGTLNNDAKSFSPFDMRITRRDGDQDLTKFAALLPPGVIGKLAGIAKCPDAQIEAARHRSGRAELASPSCPQSSQIGETEAGAGVGSQLTYVPGRLYLAGPYHGDPLSVVSVTPAVAGPFDVGTVVVRVALSIDPDTAEVKADGSASDPIPHILKGIVLKVRDLRVEVDRPGFIFNPTDCAPFQTTATLFGSGLDVFNPADDVPVTRTSRFQAANCASLGFKPAFKMSLTGGTRRGAHPALHALVTPRAPDANFAKAVVTLPHSAFLDQAHIRTICTRVQFAAKACPPGSVYGHATVFTPVLEEPLEGPVYLRSSNHNLPDLVLALHGIVDINAVGRIDSKNGGIRTSFETIPDAPFSKLVLELPGGKKGLIVNSRNLCAATNKTKVSLSAQSGKPDQLSPPLTATACKGKKAAKHKRSGHDPDRRSPRRSVRCADRRARKTLKRDLRRKG